MKLFNKPKSGKPQIKNKRRLNKPCQAPSWQEEGLVEHALQACCMIRLMIEIQHHQIYASMYYPTRLPMVLVHEVYIRSCRISILNSLPIPRAASPRPFRPSQCQAATRSRSCPLATQSFQQFDNKDYALNLIAILNMV